MVSIIIPVYNAEPYLDRCFKSLIAQTYTNWQAICVDDGSQDASASILSKWAAQDSRFIVVTQPNKGVSAARNEGIRHATGQYIYYLDADDFIHSQTLDIATSLAKRCNVDIVTWEYDRGYRKRLLMYQRLGMPIKKIPPLGKYRTYRPETIQGYITHHFLAHLTEEERSRISYPVRRLYVWRALFRKTLLEGIPFLEGIMHEEQAWWCSVMLRNPSVCITGLPLYYYYPNKTSQVFTVAPAHRMHSLLTNFEDILPQYNTQVAVEDIQHFRSNLLWPILKNLLLPLLPQLTREESTPYAIRLRALIEAGLLQGMPHTPYEKVARRIIGFVELFTQRL